MKTFKNQQTRITIGLDPLDENKKKEMTYVDLVMMILSIPPVVEPNGAVKWPRAEQKLRFKIEDKIEKLKIDEAVELEDAEFDKIFSLSQLDWQFKHRDILRYLDDLDEWNKEN